MADSGSPLERSLESMQWKDWVHATQVEVGRERNKGNDRWRGRQDMTFAMRESGREGESSSDKVTGTWGRRCALVRFPYEPTDGTRGSVESGVFPGGASPVL